MDIVEIDSVKIDVGRAELSAEMTAAMRAGKFENAERKLAARFIKPTDRVIEIGTCTGLVAMCVARIVGASNVFSYEANPAAVALARHHFELNGLDVAVTNCILVPEARYVERAEDLEFYVAPQLVSSSLTSRKGRTRVQVPTRSLEREIASRRANVIVCDIEGGEVDLFSQADLSGVDRIIMEEHSRRFGDESLAAMLAALDGKGLSFAPENRYGDVICVSRTSRDIAN